ncbi:protein ZW2-like [Silene latifolia]|uniref:protein ZW2-like n=1 Tax=Silene latifolia TaxID=37657 RepID=UPI003D76F322
MTSGGPSHSSTSNSVYSFEGFLRDWHHQQDEVLAKITAALGDGKRGQEAVTAEVAEELIARALGHFEEYYEHKSRAAHDNVLSMFSPPWCSSFECAFLWVAGFRPCVLLQLVTDSVGDLSARQIQAIDRLKRETRVEEKNIADDLAKIQENTAAPPMIHALKSAPTRSDEEQSTRPATNEALEQLQVVLEEVVANADILRVNTAARVAEILTPPQGLRFLAAVIRQQQSMRRLGIERNNRPCRGRSS